MKCTSSQLLVFFFLLLSRGGVAQIQCCCTSFGCFNGNAGFNCNDWCIILGQTNDGALAPYPDPAACAADCNAVLPVELSYFIALASENGVKLSWETSLEVNNEGFEIQYLSELDKEWQIIGIVEGMGGTNEATRYTFFHDKVSSGLYFYRLKQVDRNGEFSYSKIITVDVSKDEEFLLWPNPVRDHLFIRSAEGQSRTEYAIKILDALGKVVLEQSDSPAHLNLQGLKPASYVLLISSKSKIVSQRIVKSL